MGRRRLVGREGNGILHGSHEPLRLGALKLQQPTGNHSKPFGSRHGIKQSASTAKRPPLLSGLTTKRVSRCRQTAKGKSVQTTTRCFRPIQGLEC